jgi:ABC-type amino acid transport substrate-binding protein
VRLIKLYPVISHLVESRPDLAVVMQVPTHEEIGVAFANDRLDLCQAVNEAMTTLRANGTLAKLKAAWFGNAGGARTIDAFSL